ncbi:MAG: acyl-CoA dehydratase activase [Bacteroidales bacterium]|nr:acyl-CoA dehydratase activase [Bacteroidales bacterium]
MRVNTYKIGIDAGSTTLKLIVLDHEDQIVHESYLRHKADVSGILKEELLKINNLFPESLFQICLTGSAGMGIAERIQAPFVQEVVASVELVPKKDTHVSPLLDLGGEDTKMVFFEENRNPEIRMNGNCAGGTGAFIDQMASLLHIPVEDMNKEALKKEKIYPIASRCGVFAKTDIQNLISRNIPVPDIAASTLHAVAMQNITSLARGYDIQSPVLCVGGPLTFIPALKDAFSEALHFESEKFILPHHGEYFPAFGAALHIKEDFNSFHINQLIDLLSQSISIRKDVLPPLFKDEKEYNSWKAQRNIKKLCYRSLEGETEINCFIGIDSGSTTTKIIVLDEEHRILYKYYSGNEGNALKKVIEGLDEFYDQCRKRNIRINVLGSAATGYGEDLIRSALNLDFGVVETMAHLYGAQFVDPKVSFILDIGGQDMKSIFIENGVISNIELNEACSAGCGSFLQNFASTMHMDLSEFSQKACLASYPGDLGSRCTVFMNSKVKQSLRENASVGDIAAGLAYSVVKNCLFKVLKISNLNHLGDHIVVQGGTFKNDAVFRALELLSEKSVGSTDHPELMGAFGAALFAQSYNKEKKLSSFSFHSLDSILNSIQTKEIQCKGCTNTCSILRFRFENGNTCYAGNKCEKIFFNSGSYKEKGYNAFDKKNEILWLQDKTSQPEEEKRMKIGIPRVLNMYENFPFWNALFTSCGYDVILSPESTFSLYQKGVSTVMSDNICFPAKLVHGHILALIEQKVDRIFYPYVPMERKEFKSSNNSFNCPVVSGYPDVVRSSIDPSGNHNIPFDAPVVGFNSDKVLEKACAKYFEQLGVKKDVFNRAFKEALKVRKESKRNLIGFQKKILLDAIDKKLPVFVIAGRPYHADPLIHQKTGQILADLGAIVLTDDVFRAEEENGYSHLSIVSQWSYPNRVIQSALQVAKLPANVQLIQLNSFGCGPDSFIMDEAMAILKQSGKNLTIIRIDEIASPGSVRLRLRSLLESLKNSNPLNQKEESFEVYNVPFTKKDRTKVVLIPWMCDFINPFAPALGELAGYKVENLPKSDRLSVDLGLKYGHNEVCYPSTLVVGDIIKALQSGKYDLDNVVVSITQTGGQCRATNYIAQIKTALERAGYSDIPVLALTAGKTFQNDQRAFKLPVVKLANIAIYTVLYGDSIQQMYAAVKPREKNAGDTQKVFDFYMEAGSEAIRANDAKRLMLLLEQAVADFNTVPVYERNFEKIGLIGEIFVKYNNYAQAFMTDWLRDKGMEVVTPPIMDFVLQFFINSKVHEDNGSTKKNPFVSASRPLLWKYVTKKLKECEEVMKHFRYYTPSESIFKKAEYAQEAVSLSNQFGEGWMIAAEVACFARSGVKKVVCIQPFGCIANHIVAKGIEKRLKKLYPDISILYLDLDGGMGEVNLQNRLYFMI